jgi:tetratricopeptide (TPR) repeat protein
MKKNYQIAFKAAVIALLFVLPNMLLAQNANREDGSDKLIYQWYVNLNGGVTHAFGDIQSGSWMGEMLTADDMGFGFGARLGKHISPVFGIYGSFTKADLRGISGKDTKNLFFETELMDYFLGGTLSFSNLFGGYKPRLINIYGTAGIGFTSFDARAYKQDTDPPELLTSDRGDGGPYLNTTETMMPVGIGVDFRLNDRWDINLETTLRLLDGDKLDGYVGSNETNIWGNAVSDGYYYTSLGVGYSFWKTEPKAKMKIETEPALLALHGDSIPIEIKGTFPGAYTKNAVVDFTPVLKYGTQTKQLETIYFQGTEVEEQYKKAGAITMPTTGGPFTYTTYVKYEPGMEVCELFVEPMASIKGRTPISMGDRKLADGLLMTSKRFENNEVVRLSDHGFRRDVVISEKGIIYYVVNRHDLNFDYRLNRDVSAKEALEKMNQFMAKGWEFKNVEINAWASPEGEESFNKGLSVKRGETAQTYVEREYKKFVTKQARELKVAEADIRQDIKFNISANGEDWSGFMKAIQDSDIKDKNIIANVVNSQPDPAKREQEIRNMTIIYKEIEENILPPLRRAEISLNCFEPTRTDEEIAQLAATSPGQLSMKELLYAATLTDDPNAQLNIYKTATTQYPDDYRGFNNAGFASMQLGDFEGAKNYFGKARSLDPDDGIVLNNSGVIFSKEKDFKKAQENYMAAQKKGVDVNYNMGIVRIAQGNYNAAINSFGVTKCDYNLALAHVLSGNYNAATSTLNCAEKTPRVHYLQAIIGARTNNDNMVFENLKKAIAEDASYVEIAREDMEFLKYYSNPGFLDALK